MTDIIEVAHNCYSVNGHSVVFIPEINGVVCECPGGNCDLALRVKMSKHKHIYKFLVKIGNETKNKCVVCGYIKTERMLVY